MSIRNATTDFTWLETMEPGPKLAAAVASLEVERLPGEGRVALLVAHRRLAAHYMGKSYEDIASVERYLRHDERSLLGVEHAAAEVGAALQLTRRAAESETALALDLVRRVPAVLGALVRGEIDVRRACTLVHGTAHLSPAVARRVTEDIVGDAAGWTTGQLAARLRRMCIEAEPDDAQERYRCALAERRVVSRLTDQGTAHLHLLDLPPDRVAAFTRWLDRAARRLQAADAGRTMDQLRADIVLDLLEGRRSVSGGGVHLHVDLVTLTRLADTPGELAGMGPVVAEIARQVADRQRRTPWDVTVTDPQSGRPVHVGPVRRRPMVAQRRRLAARYPTCIWPGCRMPSVDCDLDHTVPFAAGGCTHDHNLGPLCRHHHRIRHQARWTYRRLVDGSHEWTSRLGRSYVTSGTPP